MTDGNGARVKNWREVRGLREGADRARERELAEQAAADKEGAAGSGEGSGARVKNWPEVLGRRGQGEADGREGRS